MPSARPFVPAGLLWVTLLGCPIGLANTPIAVSTPEQDGRSPLDAHVARVERGQGLLVSLVEHLAPPRHRMEVRVETERLVRGHTARPDLHVAETVSRRVRAFRTEAGWQLESLPGNDLEGTARPKPNVIRARGGLLWGIEGRDPATELRTNLLIRAPFPETLARYLETNGRVLDVLEADGETHVLLELYGGRALVRLVELDYGTERVPGLVGVDWLTHDELLGDVVEALTLDTQDSPGPGVVAGWRVVGPLGTFESSRVTAVELDSGAESTPSTGGCEPKPTGPPEVVVRELGPGALELLIGECSSRVLALDLGAEWIVLEAPVSSRVGEAIVAALTVEKPGHPIGYAAVSHHHPHYLAGLRPLVDAGAAVVCPESIADYVEHILRRPRTLQPDGLARSRRAPEVIGVEFGGLWAPPDREHRLIAVEAGGLSSHTEGNLTFVLPDLRLGFGGDLLWVPVDGERAAPSPRTLDLVRILEGAELEVSEYLTSWPVSDEPVAGTRWRDRVVLRELPRPR